MKVDAYKVLEDCIEYGVKYGYKRAYKHTDEPTEEQMTDEIERAIMNQICGYFTFDPNDPLEDILSDIRDNTRKLPRGVTF